MEKLRVGIIGATGMVGQRFIKGLENHPWFEITVLAASERSAGFIYRRLMKKRWVMNTPIPKKVVKIKVKNASNIAEIAKEVDFIFCAVDMEKDKIRELEDAYAKAEIPVVSNNSAHRWTLDVPMILPEINDAHLKIIDVQKKRLGTKRGFVVVKPNCSIQSYVPLISPLMKFQPIKITVCTHQAISGAGKTFESWPEMLDSVIPYIGGEEEKSEKEPLKIWGSIVNNEIVLASKPLISAQCFRVPVSDGHMAAICVSFPFAEKPSKEKILELWKNFKGKPQILNLPSAPKQFIKYFEEENRPQTNLDRDIENGMGITAGRLRDDNIFDYKFVGLSHNTIRGAAGGAILIAELLVAEGYISKK
ncbi:MAG: aspartate-semialdehyde dehydrogenase [bacterium]